MQTAPQGKAKMKAVDENTFFSVENAPDSERLLWDTTSRTRSFDTVIFGLNTVHRKSRDGREGDFVEIDTRDGVNIIPYFIGTDGVARFVMERQFRHGSESITLEFPAGLIERGEAPVKAAARELLEETGIRAASLKQLGAISQNAAYINNTIYYFLAETLTQEVGLEDRQLDAFEQIDVISVPVDTVLEKLGTGEYDNAIAVLGGYFFQREMALRNKS